MSFDILKKLSFLKLSDLLFKILDLIHISHIRNKHSATLFEINTLVFNGKNSFSRRTDRQKQLLVKDIRYFLKVMPFHHVSPNSEILINFVFFEKIYFLQGVIHFFFLVPFLLAHKASLFPNELSYTLTADGHILIRVLFFKLYYMVIVWVGSFVQVEKVLTHIWEVFEEFEHYSWCYILVVFKNSLPSKCFSKIYDGFGVAC